MCIIVYKPAGKTVPEDTLRACYNNNHDGAGLVWYDASARVLRLQKALMTEDEAVKAMMAVPSSAPAILHFRITTHGTDARRQTHPFCVSTSIADVERTRATIKRGYAVAHNGIFRGLSIGPEYSDTEAYIVKILAPLARLTTAAHVDLLGDDMRPIIEASIDNCKLAIMDTQGRVKLYGHYECVDGVYYSNSTYKRYTPPAWTSRMQQAVLQDYFTAVVPKTAEKRVKLYDSDMPLRVTSAYNSKCTWSISPSTLYNLYIAPDWSVWRKYATSQCAEPAYCTVVDDPAERGRIKAAKLTTVKIPYRDRSYTGWEAAYD